MSFNINGIPIVENVGTLGLFSGVTDPSGWAICDGISRSNLSGQYNNLYNQLTGKNYGYNPTWTNYTYNVSNITAQDWNDTAISSNGQYILAASNNTGGGFVYLSTNSGVFWSAPLGTSITYQLAWNGVAVSPSTNALGYYVMAAVVNGQSVYLSTNTGVNWSTVSSLSSAAWSAISMNSNGSTIAVIASGSQIYVSTNMGTSWTPYGSALAYTDIAVSLTGQYMAASVSGGQIYVSTSFGKTWTAYATVQSWSDVYISGAANIMVAAANNGPLYISTNTGQTWASIITSNNVLPTSANWANIGISSDGTYLVATINGGSIYTSTNSGSFWSNVQTTVTGTSDGSSWSNCLAISGNGSTIVAGQSTSGTGALYVSINTAFIKQINASTWSANNIPTTINVLGGTITLVDVRGVAVSDVGTVVMADCGSSGLYISQNNGSTWSTVTSGTLPAISFSCVDISSDGTKIVAAANVVGYGLYVSNNSGSTWTQLYTNNGLPTDLISMDNGSNKVAISNDGTKISVAYTNGYVYYSSNSGSTFKVVTPISSIRGGTISIPKNYWGLGMSKDGTSLVTAVNNGSLVPNFSLINSPSIWTTNPGTGLPTSATYAETAMSYSGQLQVVVQTSGTVSLWISTNYGNLWYNVTGYGTNGGVTVSGDGKYIIALNTSGYISYSSTYGANWFVTASAPGSGTNPQIFFACSCNAQFLIYVGDNGNTVLSSNYGNYFTTLITGGRYGGVAMSATGQYVFIGGVGGSNNVRVSSNYGVSFVISASTGARNMGRASMSGNGQYILVGEWTGGQPCALSTNYGVNFFTTTSSYLGQPLGVNVSYTGQIMVFDRYYSTNYGTTWSAFTSLYGYSAISMSANGQYLLSTTSPTSTGTVQLAKFPFPANGQNYIGQYWNKNQGTGLPSSDTYNCVATSYNGQYVLTVGGTSNIYLSSNYGNYWSVNTSLNPGGGVGIIVCYVSYTGKYMLVAGQTNAYTSSSYGTNWKLAFAIVGGTRGGGISSLPLSNEGKYMIITINGNGGWFSSNYGASWRQIVSAQLNGSAISATGQYIIYGCYSNPWRITMSTDYGINFSTSYSPASGSTYNFMGFSMSETGQYMLSLTFQGGAFFVSSTYGVSWTQVSSSIIGNGSNYWGASVSASGQYMMGGSDGNNVLYFSTNYGIWWVNIVSATYGLTNSGRFAPICISANAQYAYGSNGSTLYGSSYNTAKYWIQQNQVGQSSTINPGGLSGSGWQQVGVSQNGQYVFIANTTSGSSVISSTYGASFRQISAVGAVYVCSMSYNGQFILTSGTTGNPYLSTNYGVNWKTLTVVPSGQYIWAAGISGNGQYIASATRSSAFYLSSNYGVDFVSNPGSGLPTTNYYDGIAISYTGQYMYTSNYKTSNFGNNWTSASIIYVVGNSISTSASGQYVLVCNPVTSILSTNYGASFYQISADAFYGSSCMSWNGKYMLYGNHFSNNYGQTFTTLTNAGNGCGMSANANYIYYFGTSLYVSTPQNVDGGISYSSDSGNNWINGGGLNGPHANLVAISGDGSTVLANYYNDAIYLSTGSANSFGFAQTVPAGISYGLALSSTGQNAIITQQNGSIYTTTSYGSNWIADTVNGTGGQTITDNFYGAASISQNGQVAGAAASGLVYTSTTVNSSGQVAFTTGAGSTFNANNQNFSTQFGSTYNTYGNQSITSQTWSSVSISSNGQVMAAASSNSAGGYVFISTSSGTNWSSATSLSSSQLNFSSVALSATGKYALATVTGGNLYVSANASSGAATWSTVSNAQTWTYVALSSSGQTMVAVGTTIQPYVSTNYGTNWSSYGSVQNYSAVAMSSTGQYVAATVTAGKIYLSTNAGAYWSMLSNSTTSNWTSISMSSSGQFIIASAGTALYLSTSLGQSWSALANTIGLGFWSSVSISNDGTRIVATTNSGYIYTSINSGTTWSIVTSTADNSRAWQAIAISSDSSKAIAAVNPGQVYTSTDGQALTFTPITMPSVTTIDGTTMKYIIKF